MKECECKNWCDLDHRGRLLTGHHDNCEHSSPIKQRDAALELIKELCRGIELWASDEDGVHDDVWIAYCKGKALEGVIIDPHEERD